MQRDLGGVRVTMVGLGTRGGGLGVARYLVAQGAEVTITDQRPAESLAEALAALTGLPRRRRLSVGSPTWFRRVHKATAAVTQRWPMCSVSRVHTSSSLPFTGPWVLTIRRLSRRPRGATSVP